MNDRILRTPSIGAVGSVLDTLPIAVREAIDEAYTRGLSEGYQRARGDLAQHGRILATKLETTRCELVDVATTTARRDAATVVALAESLASWFVGRSVSDDIHLLVPIVDELLADAGAGIDFELCIHPALADLVIEHLPTQVSAVKPDPGLALGEIRLSSQTVTIERVWSNAIERARHGLHDDIARQRRDQAND